MLDCDLFEVLVPVFLESDLFFPFRIKFAHDVVEAGLEALLKLRIILVARPDDCFMVQRVLHLNLTDKFILDGALRSSVLRSGFRRAVRS